MSIFSKLLGIRYKVDNLYFVSEENATTYSDMNNNADVKTKFFCYFKQISDEVFERAEQERISQTGFSNHRDR